MGLLNLLTAYQKKHLVEFLPYHECDTQSRQAPDLECLIKLQAQHTQQRHLIFLTGGVINLLTSFLAQAKKLFLCVVVLVWDEFVLLNIWYIWSEWYGSFHYSSEHFPWLILNAHWILHVAMCFYREAIWDVPTVLKKWNSDREHWWCYEWFSQSDWLHQSEWASHAALYWWVTSTAGLNTKTIRI